MAMYFLDTPLKDLTPDLVQTELDRAEVAHRAYANALRATKRLLEAKTEMEGVKAAKPVDTEEENGA